MKNVNKKETQKHNSSDNFDFDYSCYFLEEQIADMANDFRTIDDIENMMSEEIAGDLIEEEIEAERNYHKTEHYSMINYLIVCNDEAKKSLTEKVEVIKPAIGNELYMYLIVLLDQEEIQLKIESEKIWHLLYSKQ